LKSLSGKELSVLLKENGWELKRVRGSHHVYTKEGSPARISVPMHGNKPLKRGLLLHLMKLAEIEKIEV
jgi:predicted RNA binding protein YcfA (HicA-like mRNA interferase family)